MNTRALVIRFQHGLDVCAILDAQRAVLTINTEWWATLSPAKQTAFIAHETKHLDMAEAWVKWAQEGGTMPC